jgi:hypothetical protein
MAEVQQRRSASDSARLRLMLSHCFTISAPSATGERLATQLVAVSSLNRNMPELNCSSRIAIPVNSAIDPRSTCWADAAESAFALEVRARGPAADVFGEREHSIVQNNVQVGPIDGGAAHAIYAVFI